jgi:hypothetical protein
MLVCIDESGCSGFKAGSTPCFVIVMVIFRDYAEAEKTSATIARLRERLGVKPEFRFSKCSKDVRTQFFAFLSDHQFKVRALIIEKARVYSPHLRSESESFYNFFLKLLVKHNEQVIRSASIKIDGSGDRKFKQALYNYLRKQLNAGTIKKLKFVNSKSDNLIQLANMVAGALARSYEGRGGRPGDARWRRMIHRHVEDIWQFR